MWCWRMRADILWNGRVWTRCMRQLFRSPKEIEASLLVYWWCLCCRWPLLFCFERSVADLILIRCTLTPINPHLDTSVEKLLYCLTFLGVKRKRKSMPPMKTSKRICLTKRRREWGRNCGRWEARTAEKNHLRMQTQRSDSSRGSFVSVYFLWHTRFFSHSYWKEWLGKNDLKKRHSLLAGVRSRNSVEIQAWN